MPKRNQVNVTFDDPEMNNVNEYCRVHGLTPQGFLRTGAKRLIQEDILERNADIRTLKAWKEVCEGKSEPIDDLLKMIEDDSKAAAEMIAHSRASVKG